MPPNKAFCCNTSMNDPTIVILCLSRAVCRYAESVVSQHHSEPWWCNEAGVGSAQGQQVLECRMCNSNDSDSDSDSERIKASIGSAAHQLMAQGSESGTEMHSGWQLDYYSVHAYGPGASLSASLSACVCRTCSTQTSWRRRGRLGTEPPCPFQVRMQSRCH